MKKYFIVLATLTISFSTLLSGQTWSVDSLPHSVFWGATQVSESKLVMMSDTTVNIYDDVTRKWTVTSLSFSSDGSKPTAIGDKIYFLQGLNAMSANSRKLDIYNTKTNTWKRDSMPFAINSAGLGSIGSKLFVAGGMKGSTIVNSINVFDTLTQTWSSNNTLSVGRLGIEVIRVKNKLLFIGGYSNAANLPNWIFFKNIDIYDETTGLWSTVFMKTGRLFPRLAVSGSKVLIASGINRIEVHSASYWSMLTNTAEVYDVETNTWQTADFPNARSFQSIGVYSNKAYIVCGAVQDFVNPQPLYDKIDIYNFTTNIWSTQPFPFPNYVRTGATVALKNRIFFIGGLFENNIPSTRMDILTLMPTGGLEQTALTNKLSVFPNPVSNTLTVDFEKTMSPFYAIKISNILGQIVYSQTHIEKKETEINVNAFDKGLYFLTIQINDRIKTQTFVKE